MALKSRRVAENLEQYISSLGYERFGVTIEMDELELELLPPGIAVGGVTVRRPNREEPWLTLHRGRVLIRPWPSAAGALVIHALELDGLEADIDLRGVPPHTEGKAEPRLGVDIRELLVWNANLRVTTDARVIELRRADLEMVPSRDGRAISVSVRDGAVIQDGLRLPVELQARGALSGTLDEPTRLSLTRAVVSVPRVAAELSGALQLDDARELDGTFTARAPLASISRLLPELPALRGDATCELSARGPLDDLRTRAKLAVQDLEIEGGELGDLEVEAVYTDERINVEAFRLSHRSLGGVTGSGTVELTRRLPVTLTARLHRASLPDVLERAGLANAWVRLAFSGDVAGTGHLRPLRLQLDVDGVIDRFLVLDRSFHDPAAESYFVLAATDVQGMATITSRRVTVSDTRVTRGESVLRVEGSLSFDPEVGLDLRAAGEQMNLADIGPIAGGTYGGRGTVAGAVEGPYANPTVSGTVDVTDFAAYGYFLGDAKGTIIYHDLVLGIDRAGLRRADGSAEVSGAFDFRGKELRVKGEARLSGIRAADALETLGVDAAVARRVGARLDGVVQLDGPLLQPAGSVTLSARQLAVDGAALGPMELEGGFAPQGELIWGEARVRPEQGRLHARAALRDDGRITLQAEVEATPLSLARPFLGDAELEGAVTGSVALSGPPQRLSGQIEAALAGLSARGIRLGTTRVRATVAEGSVRLSGTVLDGNAAVDAAMTVGEQLTYTVTVGFRDLAAERLFTLPAGVSLVASGTIFSQGNLASLETVTADARLEQVRVDLGKVVLRSTRPVRLQYAERSLRINDLVLADGQTALSAVGSLGADGALDLTVAGGGELRALAGVTSKLDWLRGRFELRAQLDGDLTAPRMAGSASVTGGAVRLASSAPVLDQIGAKLSFSGRSISIDSGSATLGGGSVLFGGQILLPEQHVPELNINVELKSVSMQPLAETLVDFGGNLSLVGPTDDLLLRGRIKLASLRYTANLDLDRLIPRHDATPLKVPAFDPDQAVRLAVSVRAPNNIIISNNVLDAELRADLMVVGTTQRMGLVGSATPLWAKARYRDNVFTVTRGSIDFSEEYRIFTIFDIHAVSEACGMGISVDVQGSSERYTATPSGHDESGPVDPQDVLFCLQTGMRLRDYEDQQRLREISAPSDPDDAGDTSPLNDQLVRTGIDTIWAVSGMDAKVRKLLPIKLDEIRIDSAWSSFHGRTTTRLHVGKDLGGNLQLRYSRALEEVDDQTLSVQYRLSEVAALQGTWLSASDVAVGDLGLDLRLRWEFR